MTGDAAALRPARGYKWADAGPGNTLAFKHGAHSLRYVDPAVEAMRPVLIEMYPHLQERYDIFAIDRYLHKEVQAGALRRYVAEIIEKNGVGAVKDGTWKNLNAADAQAAKFGAQLGIDPMSRSRLQATVASTEATLADLAAQGRQTAGYRANAPKVQADG